MITALLKLKGDFSFNRKVLNKLIDTAHQTKLSVIKAESHEFFPQGFTAFILLAESHIAIHTYPEKREAFVDIFLCNPMLDIQQVIKALVYNFNAEILKEEIIER